MKQARIEIEKQLAEDYVRRMFERVIKRPGKDELLKYMEENGFFTAPASTKYHMACEGGLVIHSAHVAQNMIDMAGLGENKHEMETLEICGLLHDFCKMDQYKKNPDGTFSWNPDQMPLGQGEKSVIQIMEHMKLTKEEQLAIRWHMAGWDEAAKGGDRNINAAYERSTLAVLLAMADMQATYIDER